MTTSRSSNSPTSGARGTVHTYRRPLGEHLNPLLDAGFRIEEFREPTPEEEFRDERPERYERLTTVPRWEYVRARKPE